MTDIPASTTTTTTTTATAATTSTTPNIPGNTSEPQLGTHYIFSNIFNTGLSEVQWIHYRSVVHDNETLINDPIILAYLKLIESNIPCVWIKTNKPTPPQQQQQMQRNGKLNQSTNSSPSPPLINNKTTVTSTTNNKTATAAPMNTLKTTSSPLINSVKNNTPTSPSHSPIIVSSNSPPYNTATAGATVPMPTSPTYQPVLDSTMSIDSAGVSTTTTSSPLDSVNGDIIDLWIFPIVKSTSDEQSSNHSIDFINTISELQSISKIDSGKWESLDPNPIITNLLYKSLFNIIEHKLIQTNNFTRVGNSFMRKQIEKKSIKDPFFESLRQLNCEDISELSFSFSFFLSNRLLLFHLVADRKRVQNLSTQNLTRIDYLNSPIITSPNCFFSYTMRKSDSNEKKYHNHPSNFTISSNQWKQLFNINLRSSLAFNNNNNSNFNENNNENNNTVPISISTSSTSITHHSNSDLLDRPKQLELFGIQSTKNGIFFPTELLYRYIPYTSDNTTKFYHEKMREFGLENEDQSALAQLEKGLSLFGRKQLTQQQQQQQQQQSKAIDYWNYQIPFIFSKDQQQQQQQQDQHTKQMFSPATNSPFPSSPSQNQGSSNALHSPFNNSPKSPATSPMASPDEQPSPADSLDASKKRSATKSNQKKGSRTSKRKKDDEEAAASTTSTSSSNTTTTATTVKSLPAQQPTQPQPQPQQPTQPQQQQQPQPQQQPQQQQPQQPQHQQVAPQQASFNSSIDLFGSDSLGDALSFKKDDDLMHLSDTDIDLDSWTNHYSSSSFPPAQRANAAANNMNGGANNMQSVVPNSADAFVPNNFAHQKQQQQQPPPLPVNIQSNAINKVGMVPEQQHQPPQSQQPQQVQQPITMNDLSSNTSTNQQTNHPQSTAATTTTTSTIPAQSAPINVPSAQHSSTQNSSTTTSTTTTNTAVTLPIDHTKSPINPAYLVPYKAPSLSQANIPTMPDVVPELFGSAGSATSSHHLFHGDRDINGSGSDTSSNSLLLSGGGAVSNLGANPKSLSNLQYTPEGTSNASLSQYLQQISHESLRTSLDDSVEGLTSVYSTLAVSKLGEQQLSSLTSKNKSSYYCPPSYKPIDEASLPFQTKFEYSYVPLSKSVPSTSSAIKYTPTTLTNSQLHSSTAAAQASLNHIKNQQQQQHQQQLHSQNSTLGNHLHNNNSGVGNNISNNSKLATSGNHIALPNSPVSMVLPSSPVLSNGTSQISDRESDMMMDAQSSSALFSFDNVLSPITNTYIQQLSSNTSQRIFPQSFSYEKVMSPDECHEFANLIQQLATSNYDVNQGYSIENSPMTKLTVEMLLEEWTRSLVSTGGNIHSPALQYHALTEEVNSESVYSALNPLSKPVLLNLTAKNLFGFSSMISDIFFQNSSEQDLLEGSSPLSLADTDIFSSVEWLPVPRMVVGYKEEWMEAPSTIIRHWDKALIEPYSPKKNITYYVLCPDTGVMKVHAPAFFSDISHIYEINHLGHHQHFTTTLTVTTTVATPVNINNQFQNKHHHHQQQQQTTTTTTSINNTTNSGLFPQGIYYIPTLASTSVPNQSSQDPNQLLMSSYLTACSKLSDHLKEISLQYNENNNIVVYIVNPFTESSQFGNGNGSDSNTVYQRQRESLLFINSCHRAIMKETFLNESLNITVQSIPIEEMFLDDSQTVSIAKEIAFSIFNKCRRISTLSPIINGVPPTTNFTNWCQRFADKIYEPMFILSQPQKPQQLTQQPNNIHVSYMLSDNNRWVACTITDDRGEMLECKLIPTTTSEYSGELVWRETLLYVWSFIFETINLILLSNGIAARAIISKFGLISKEEYEEWQKLVVSIPERNPLESVVFVNLTMHPYLQLFSSEFLNDAFSKSQDTLILPVFSLKGQSYAIYPKSPFIYNYHLNNPLPIASSFVVTSYSNNPTLSQHQTNFENKKELPSVYMISVIGGQNIRSQFANGGNGSGMMVDQFDPSETIKQITKIYHRLSYLNISPRYPDRYSILPIHHTITKRMSRLAGYASQKSSKPLQAFHQLKTPVSNWSSKLHNFSPLPNNPTSPQSNSSATGSPMITTINKDDTVMSS